MKNLFYLTSIGFLIGCLILLAPSNTVAQSQQQTYQKDSLVQKVLYSTSVTSMILPQNLVDEPNNLWAKKSNAMPLPSQAALTGPGKVVTCIMILSCLFFYFNRKK